MLISKVVLEWTLSGDSAIPYQWQFTAGTVTTRCVGGFTDIGAGLTGVVFSSVAWGDYDNDGDVDILLSGGTSGGPVTQVWRNDGGSFSDIGAGLTRGGRVAWGDYDNDGDLDILLADEVYRNDGGTFTDINAGLTEVSSGSIAWGDYDNDGDLDVLLAGRDSGGGEVAQVWRNDGGTFSDIGAGLTGVEQGSVAWGDYDNDGDLDILLSGRDSGGNRVAQVYRNDGGSFSDINAGLTGVRDSSVAWGDYDNDGDLDILLSGGANGGPVTQVWRNDGGSFSDINAGLPGVFYGGVAWGDYDNDGDLDILLSGGITGVNLVAGVYRNDGGTFNDIEAGLTGGTDGGSVAWGDYDNDGDLDILLAGYDSGSLAARVYRNDDADCPIAITGLSATNDSPTGWGDPTTFTATVSSGTNISYDWAFGDGNSGSGANPSHTYGSVGSYTATVTATNILSLLKSTTVVSIYIPTYTLTVTATDPLTNEVGVALTHTISLTYSQAISPATAYSGTLVAQGMMGGVLTGTYSVNGENVTLTPARPLFPNEIVRATSTSGIQNLSGDKAEPYQWQFTAGTVTNRCVAGFSGIGADLTGVSSGGVAWGDYDNDGALDILLSGWDSGGSVAQVWRNDSGTFTDINAGLEAVSSSSVAWGDYDNDGDLDILLSGYHSGANPVAQVWRNDGGSFSDINAGLLGASSGNVAWGDYDNNGDLDILLSGYDRLFLWMARVYLNDGGAFSDINAGLPAVVGGVAWGDYDNDGDLDILLSDEVWRNDGGSFTNINAGLPAVVGGVAWGDYDNDGDLDILLSGSDGSNRIAQVWRNDGGGFSDINAGLTGVDWSSVVWGDYDNDGDLDILLSGRDSGYDPVTQVWRNDGGSFSDIGAGLTGVVNGSVAWGDYDNDGDLDILLSGEDNSYDPVTQIYRNDDCPIAEAGPNQTVAVDAPVSLDGSASSDLNGGPLTYGWRQTGGPPVSFSPTLSVTTFTAPAAPTVLSFSLTVTTSEGYTATDSTLVTVTQVSSYTLTITTVGSGTVTLNPTGGIYTENTTVTLTAIPDSGWQFSGWGGDLSGGTASLLLLMDSHKAVTAAFELLDNSQKVYLPLISK